MTDRSDALTESTLPEETLLLERQIEAINRFPDQNPNPVMRVTDEGVLVYANLSSAPITAALGVGIGDRLPPETLNGLRLDPAEPVRPPLEIGTDDWRTFAVLAVPVPEFGFVNLYGTDVTARKAIDKFPDANPNPVMRVSHDGVLLYANPASAPIRESLGIALGQTLPPTILREALDRVESGSREPLEVETAGGQLFAIVVAAINEFNFINLYGTDITAARAIERANAENERLLLNILPAPIADRLRSGERLIADRFESATLMFADIVGFTSLSARMSPHEVVEILNEVFSSFDALVDKHGLEKIKTIGDAYMVVGGVPEETPGHCARVADMALELCAAVIRMNRPEITFRVGIDTGPVVAGVIGSRKFIYDVWGNTVNTASRMESHGVAGRIQVTQAVHDVLSDSYDFEPRGVIEVRGRGPMPAWLLLGPKARLLPTGGIGHVRDPA